MWLNIHLVQESFLELSRNICAAGQIHYSKHSGTFNRCNFLPRQNITETNIGLIKGLRWEEGTLDFNMTLNHFGTIWPVKIQFAKKVIIYVTVVLFLSLSEIGFINYINTKMFIIIFRIEFQGPLRSCIYILLD